MGKGTRYPHIVSLLRKHYRGGRVLELGAGGANYRDIFNGYIGTDLPGSSYHEQGDISAFCDARKLPFADESVDFAFMIGVLCLIPKPETVCSGVSRVLKPGGKFLVFDYSLKTKASLMKTHSKNNDDVHMNTWTRAELAELLRQSGFEKTFHMESRPYWQLASTLSPHVANYLRYWLMMGGVKS